MRAEVDSAAVVTDSRPLPAEAPGVDSAQRAEIEEEVTRFGEELECHPFVPEAGASEAALSWYGKALDAYEAAGRSLRHADGSLDQALRDLSEGRHAVAALDAVLLGKPAPALEPCFFDPGHQPALTQIMWAPYGGRRRRISVCGSCAEQRRERGVPVVAAAVAADVSAGARLLASFQGRGRGQIELPGFGDAGFAVLRVRTSVLNTFFGLGNARSDVIRAVTAGETRFAWAADLLPASSSSTKCRVVIPATTTGLEVAGFGRWNVEVWSAEAGYAFAYRASGGKGADVFRYVGAGGTATVAFDGPSMFAVRVWRDGGVRKGRRGSVSFGNGKHRSTLELQTGDLLAVRSGKGAWSLDVVTGATADIAARQGGVADGGGGY